MFTFHLDIFTKWEDEALIDTFKSAPLPDNMILSWNEIKDIDDFCLPSDSYSLLITDNDDIMRRISVPHPYSGVIFGGSREVADLRFEDIDVYWIFKERRVQSGVFLKTLRNLKANFNTWFDRMMLTAIMDTSSDMMWFKNKDGVHLKVNNKFTKVVGKTKEQCEGALHNYIWDVDPKTVTEEATCTTSEYEVMNAGKMMVFDERVQIGDNQMQLKTGKSPLFDPFGNIVGTCGVAHDVTDFANMGIELSILLENLPMPLLLCDKDFGIISMNANFKEMTGLSAVELAALDYISWKKSAITPISSRNTNPQNGSIYCEYSMKKDDDEIFFMLIEQKIFDHFSQLSGYYCIFMDTTERHRNLQLIIRAANTDTLTGLYNRRYFFDYMEKNPGIPMSILYIDLDHFKEVNDTYGHARGDDVLKKTADYLREVFPNDLIARLGGDEFVVLVKDDADTSENIKESCSRLEKMVSSIFRNNDEVKVTASIGIAHTDGHNTDAEALLSEGDRMMYSIKQQHHLMRG